MSYFRQILRFLALFLVISLIIKGLSMFVRIASSWSVLATAFVGALLIEVLIRLYRYESSAVSPQRARMLVALRLVALVVLGFLLLEPSWVRKVKREIEREVVILVDDSVSMSLIDDGETKSRAQIGLDALADSQMEEKLRERLRVRTLHIARTARGADEAAGEGWQDSTDLAAALDTVLEQVPPNELAGVVMLTDGRHNHPSRVEDSARRFGILDAPIGMVAIGSEIPPRDASIVSVEAPDAIHLGDRMRVNVEALFHGYKGESAEITLFQGNHPLETRTIQILQETHREQIRFAQIPEQGGVNEYRVEIAPLQGERFDENNSWEFETAITDARTHVLIIESHPRWEFRYLRNLFYGRDKSIHLQHVLLHPDTIANQDTVDIPASADRPFGEAHATRRPLNEAEWRKFDVIMIGDIEATALNPRHWEIISRCVNDRGAMLVLIAGPRYMPHALRDPNARALVPAEMEWGTHTYFQNSERPFQFGLTSEGLRHPITQQSTGEAANSQVWAQFPAIHWRHPVKSLKSGAEVLLTAISPDEEAVANSGDGLADALKALSERKKREAENALLITRQTGKGKVALLLSDRTWRLREGAGDVYHHRFWGNLVRWGAGPVLRAGGVHLRLGTDQLSYTLDDRPLVTARLRNTDLTPVTGATPKAEVLNAQGEVIASVPMVAVEDSEGLYEASLEKLKNAGRYQVRITGQEVESLLEKDGKVELHADFRVIGSRGPIELAETTLNLPLMQTIADLSGGKVVAPKAISELLPLFISEQEHDYEIRETSLWDNGWLLGIFALLLTSEWVLRRSSGLP